MRAALAGVAQWPFGVWVWFLVKGSDLGCRFGPGPGQGAGGRHPLPVSRESPALMTNPPHCLPPPRPGRRRPLSCFLSPDVDAARDGDELPQGRALVPGSVHLEYLLSPFKLTKLLFKSQRPSQLPIVLGPKATAQTEMKTLTPSPASFTDTAGSSHYGQHDLRVDFLF